MMAEAMQVRGLKELEAQLRDFPPKLQKRALDSALRASGKVLVDDIQRRVADDPIIAGALRIRQQRKHRRTTGAHLVIGFLRRTGAGARAAWREFGVSPHTVKARRAKALVNPKTGAFFGTEISHPGLPARPFIRPALVAAGPRAIEAMRKRLAAYIERQYRRVARGKAT